MTLMQSGNLDTLRAGLRGEVCGPQDAEYDEARRVWNGQIDRHPAAVAFCLDAADVSATIRWARAESIGITVRGGAHNATGAAVWDGELMINLARCNGIEVDPATRIARVGGGALLGDLDAATQAHGLAVPAGVVSHTGVGGLTLGGGLGWLSRDLGLTIDNLLGAEVVLADGSIVEANETEHAELFWALRGGGGNFGVVTRFDFRLHPVGPMIHLGMLFWDLENAADGLRACRELAADLPVGFGFIVGGMSAPPAPVIPVEHHLKPGVLAMLVGYGTPQVHAAQVDRLRSSCPPLFEFVSPMPYVALQQMFDEGNHWGLYIYEKGTSLPELSDGVIDVLVEQLAARSVPTHMVLMYLTDREYCTAAEDATAWGGQRTPYWATFILGINHTEDTWGIGRDWVRATWERLDPLSRGIGTYINSLADEPDADTLRATFGAKYERLRRIKTTYDPDNVFRRNANITPVGT
ncbi:MAG TPA: FAD-binding oxidoreductase [Sporichthyaceae bacterium]|nr:FAD-binding oxidoreductase [Sporichthyaceae bacterium]